MTYRPTPDAEPLREREHHPICAWCKHEAGPVNIRAAMMGSDTMTCLLSGGSYSSIRPGVNDKGQCDNYAPSVSTRVLQLVRLRLFVERIHDVTSQGPGLRIVYSGPHGQRKVFRVD